MAPMTSAERQRRYREKLKLENREKYEKLKKENAERTKKSYIKIKQLPDAKQKEQRKKWRQQKQMKNEISKSNKTEELKINKKEVDLTGLVPVPHTMDTHQVITTDRVNVIKFRKLACFCRKLSCDCFGLEEHNLKLKKQKRKCNKDQRDMKTNKRTRIENSRKRLLTDDSDTSINSEVTYAESDDSIWKADDEYDDEYGDDGVNENNEIITEENKSNVVNSKTKKPVKYHNNKITILSDIKNTPENYRYFDLKNYGPFKLHEINKIQIHKEHNMKNIYDTPSPSTSDVKQKNIIIITNKDCEPEIENKDYSKRENETKEPKYTQRKKTEVHKEIDDFIYNINDSVLVRYYERKSWVYYVGFIEGIEIKTDLTYYVIRFLKTVKKPLLKFITPKKTDKDTVPTNCVVKNINLKLVSNEFMLEDDFDYTYFD